MRTLVAGIGNVFYTDDGFGVEVARRLIGDPTLPADVDVVDFGIRGIHLAFELLTPLDFLVILDCMPRGGAPGTLYVVDPAFDELPPHGELDDAHGMHLPRVFETLKTLGGRIPPHIRLIGCEPAEIHAGLGLSPTIAPVIPAALQLVRDVLALHRSVPTIHQEIR